MNEDNYTSDSDESVSGDRVTNAVVWDPVRQLHHIIHCLAVSQDDEALSEILGYAKAVAVEASVGDCETGDLYQSKIDRWVQLVGIADRYRVDVQELIDGDIGREMHIGRNW